MAVQAEPASPHVTRISRFSASPSAKSSTKSAYLPGAPSPSMVSSRAMGAASRCATGGKPDTQSLAVPSLEPVATCVPSGENATLVTPAVWPDSRPSPTASPLNVVTDVPPAVCHRTAVASSEPLRNHRASGENATARTGWLCASTERSRAPVWALHRLTTPSIAPVRMRALSGEMATDTSELEPV